MSTVKLFILRLLIRLRLFPSIFFTFMPFKIFEFKELMREVNISKDDVVLDIGCGNGIQTALVASRCKKVVGIDVSDQAVDFAKRVVGYMNRGGNIEILKLRLEDAGFESESFDKIFSICVIEHIDNYREVLEEAYRVLKRGGQMILSVDSLENIKDGALVEKHRKEYSVVRHFSADELGGILEEVGFENINVYPIFRSNFARKLFIRGLKNKFRYGYLRSIMLYVILKHMEKRHTGGDEGIFLVAKCDK